MRKLLLSAATSVILMLAGQAAHAAVIVYDFDGPNATNVISTTSAAPSGFTVDTSSGNGNLQPGTYYAPTISQSAAFETSGTYSLDIVGTVNSNVGYDYLITNFVPLALQSASSLTYDLSTATTFTGAGSLHAAFYLTGGTGTPTAPFISSASTDLTNLAAGTYLNNMVNLASFTNSQVTGTETGPISAIAATYGAAVSSFELQINLGTGPPRTTGIIIRSILIRSRFLAASPPLSRPASSCSASPVPSRCWSGVEGVTWLERESRS